MTKQIPTDERGRAISAQLREHSQDPRVLATPFDHPNYKTDDYQEFLRMQGYERSSQASFFKLLRRDLAELDTQD